MPTSAVIVGGGSTAIGHADAATATSPGNNHAAASRGVSSGLGVSTRHLDRRQTMRVIRRKSNSMASSPSPSKSPSPSPLPLPLPLTLPSPSPIPKPFPIISLPALTTPMPVESHRLVESIRRNSILSSLSDHRKSTETSSGSSTPGSAGATTAGATTHHPATGIGIAAPSTKRMSIAGGVVPGSRVASHRQLDAQQQQEQQQQQLLQEQADLSDRKKDFLVELHDQLHASSSSKEEDLLAKEKEVAVIHQILEKAPEIRDAQDVDCLFEWVMRNGCTSKIFQGAQEIVCKTICREMTLLELPANGVVCYQGDYGDVFFIIISGSVSLFLDAKHKDRNLESANDHVRRKGSKNITMDPNNGKLISSDGYGQFIKQIFSGGTFGELAVMDPTAKRSCTIVCDVPTSFICLKRAAYQRLIRLTNSFQLDFTQVEFLETLALFNAWPHGQLTRLSNRLRHMDFQADSYITRIGSETNSVYFIYAGIVQESIPLIHYLDENGVVVKCTTVQNDSFKHNVHEHTGKDQQRRRVCLELNVYQDHDVCGEYAVLFNTSCSNTDLLAITEVRTLVMDRETWKETRSMMGLDHIKDCYNKFRNLAEARENWRQTRVKLALANPGMVMSLSTRMMMKDGKCICGWCGSSDHITGDRSCPDMILAKKKQADKEKSAAKGLGVVGGGAASTPAVAAVGGYSAQTPPATARTASGASTPLENSQPASRRTSANATTDTGTKPSPPTTAPIATPAAAPAPAPETSMVNELQLTAMAIMALKRQRKSNSVTPVSTIVELATQSSRSSFGTSRSSFLDESRDGGSDLATYPEPMSSTRMYDKNQELRHQPFTSQIESQYREQLVCKVRRIHSIEEYHDTRDKVLEKIEQLEVAQATTTPSSYTTPLMLPRKPKVPKPRRFIVGPEQAPPSRFNRRINRMLRKVRAKQKQVPVVEESLRDDMPSHANVKPAKAKSHKTTASPTDSTTTVIVNAIINTVTTPKAIRNVCDLKNLR